MTRYRLSPAAAADLSTIWDYTADAWGADQANRYTLDIKDACVELADGSRKGRTINHVRPDYLKFNIGSHFIVYRKQSDVVDVIRILHQRMDLPPRLRD
jgi:toxin ParE1/3/4